eukprot:GHVN01038574.1.p1 GENE.GHVN01038574.1~~GHVN01038574.1.p1  ORF type:complete len:461 (+),score=173.67 GHVN01038574.1:182-1564(+)
MPDHLTYDNTMTSSQSRPDEIVTPDNEDQEGRFEEMFREVICFLASSSVPVLRKATEAVLGFASNPVFIRVVLANPIPVPNNEDYTTHNSIRLILRCVSNEDVEVSDTATKCVINLGEHQHAAESIIAANGIRIFCDRLVKQHRGEIRGTSITSTLMALNNLTRLHIGQNAMLMLPFNTPTDAPLQTENKTLSPHSPRSSHSPHTSSTDTASTPPTSPSPETMAEAVSTGLLPRDGLLIALAAIYFKHNGEGCTGIATGGTGTPAARTGGVGGVDPELEAIRQRRRAELRQQHAGRTVSEPAEPVGADGGEVSGVGDVSELSEVGVLCGHIFTNLTAHWDGRSFFIRGGASMISKLSEKLGIPSQRQAALRCVLHLCADIRTHHLISLTSTQLITHLCRLVYPAKSSPLLQTSSTSSPHPSLKVSDPTWKYDAKADRTTSMSEVSEVREVSEMSEMGEMS